jgi:phage shock protein E
MITQPASPARDNATHAVAKPLSTAARRPAPAHRIAFTDMWRRLALIALVAWSLPAFAATVIIDVRTPAEYATGHIDSAINIEYQLIGQQIASAGVTKDDQVILYCRSGRRSGIALETLRNLGFRGVVDYGTIEDARQKLASRRH